jgi:thiamine transport system substrate-binding protein
MPVEEIRRFLIPPSAGGGFFMKQTPAPQLPVTLTKMGAMEPMLKNYLRMLVLTTLFLTVGTALAADDNSFVTLMTHDSFAVGEKTLKAFEEISGFAIKLIKIGDAGAALSQAILSKNNPLADVFYGVDNTFLSRALRAGIFKAYNSPQLKNIRDDLKLDPHNRLLPVDFGDVCLNYDKAWFKEKGLTPPADLDDLVKPEYKNLTVVQNPAISSPGLAFLMTTIGRFGDPGYLDFWKKLRANGVHVSKGWSDAYYGQFSRYKGGTRPIVVSYASSPPVEVLFAKEKLEDAPTAAVLANKAAFRQIEFVGILKKTKKLEAARALVDFILSPVFQKDIPLNMFVFPARKGVPLPDLFVKYTRIVAEPVTIEPELIESSREKWIEAWTEAVLR